MPKREIRNPNPQKQNKKQIAYKRKNIYSQQIVDLIEQDQEIEEIYPIKRQKSNYQLPPTQQDKAENTSTQNIISPRQQICLVCCQQNFGNGKYILDCSHLFCNQCLLYWQQISQKCPVCNKISTSVLSILNGESRVNKINFINFMPYCSKCNTNSHYHLMYFCDQCNENCIHTYCQPSLMQQSASQKWVCQNCIYSTYYQNKYNQQSISSDLQQDYNIEQDSFVVSDHVVQYINDSDSNANLYDSQPTVKRENQNAKGKKESKARQKKKRK